MTSSGRLQSTGFLGYMMSDMLHDEFGMGIPWWLIALATFAIIWSLTHYGIRVSMEATAF